MSLFFIAIAAWLAIGAAAVVAMHRRGHDTFSWAILFVFLGPLALPLAVSSERHPPSPPPWPDHDGAFDVLVAHDGSAATGNALDATLELLGERVTSITLAAVVDTEAASTVRGAGTCHDADERLGAAAEALRSRTAAPVETVVLFGEPCHALSDFAAAHGYELIVGPARVAKHARVPVLVSPR